MFTTRCLFYFILLSFTHSVPQINFYYTDSSSEDHYAIIERNCLRVPVDLEEAGRSHQAMFYCLHEFSSDFYIESNHSSTNFTFAELAERNIGSEQLLAWSAPIDVIENYQDYLNEKDNSDCTVSAQTIFYNCTWPRFGPFCAYEFDYYQSNHSSLYNIVHDFYETYEYDPTDLTCYILLACNRGPSPACLDWSEVCNGKVDCLDGNFDEEHCWQLHRSTCEENAFQCLNGQCIPQLFFDDQYNTADCFDGSDETMIKYNVFEPCGTNEPNFGCEDTLCHDFPLTKSCVFKREQLLLQALFSAPDDETLEECWLAFTCLVTKNVPDELFCDEHCDNDACVESITRSCPEMLFIPTVPILFGHVYFAYHKDDAQFLTGMHAQYVYVCYNNSLYDAYFGSTTKVLFAGTTCYRRADILPVETAPGALFELEYLAAYERDLWEYNIIGDSDLSLNYISTMCNRSNMYQCLHSRQCVRKQVFADSANDCPYGDDETLEGEKYAELTGEYVGLIQWYEDTGDVRLQFRNAKKNISFQIICDGFTELLPVTINGRNETDETNCEPWPCNNTYTRCNGLWNCADGADEAHCHSFLPFHCSFDEHVCVSIETSALICLSMEKANDGHVDCLGATDEPYLCLEPYQILIHKNFHCVRPNSTQCLRTVNLCDGVPDCSQSDDEKFCMWNRTDPYVRLCDQSELSSRSDVENYFCQHMDRREKLSLLPFLLDGPSQSVEPTTKNIIVTTTPFPRLRNDHESRCHRGLDLRVSSAQICLCPPSFYGDRCQYQNQRVSLTMKFQSLSDSRRTLLAIVVLLIDDSAERLIHSSEQFTYLPIKDCEVKYNVYLLYATRPKDPARNYSVHVDIYEKAALTYRGSFIFPIIFAFLPVYRLAVLVDIPGIENNILGCSDNICVHGQCVQYLNNLQNRTFCRCEHGWSGQDCSIRRACQCSIDSRCLGLTFSNRSVCVCPVHRFGPRCLLRETVCQMDENAICLNDGTCVSNDDYNPSVRKFTCVCRQGFVGDRCERIDYNFSLSFSEEIEFSQSISIHFIELFTKGPPARSTLLRNIPFRQPSMTVYRTRPFHLVFTELENKNYYLIISQTVYNRSKSIVKEIGPLDRCRHISEVLNTTVVQLDLIRRIKYYHLPCQQFAPALRCFYDDVHLCLCYEFGQYYLSNCLEFNHSMTFDCFGRSECQNGGQCFQDKPDCPETSVCVCPPCFYGSRCQFSTKGFGLSLDAILGYHIQPHLRIGQQASIVQFSLALTVTFVLVGVINAVLSMITFTSKNIRQVGCGLYLLGSSVNTMFTTIIFALKFSILLLGQMNVKFNRSFLAFECHSMDFLLRISLNMDQWLNACVALERAFTVMQGLTFSKKKSKQVAKFVIATLLLLIIGSSVQESMYRRLIDEENENEKRTWCIITYPPRLQTYVSVMHPFHVLGPFLINLLTAILLTTKISRQQSTLHIDRAYKDILREQCAQQKHLFTAPMVLVLLTIPRLIIAFSSKCMRSADDAWVYLGGYFISFIPPMLTFVVFVLPSTSYKKEFFKSFASYRMTVRRWLHLIS